MGVESFVLVHGGFYGAWCWERLVPLLDGRALAVDLPGRGQHPSPMEDVTLEACVRSVIADMDEAGLERVVLVGHSLGGATVPVVAARIPDRVAHLVLVSCLLAPEAGSIADGFPPEFREQARRRMGEAPGALVEMDETTHREVIGDELDESDLRWLLAHVGPDSRHLFTDAASRSGLPDALPRTYVRLRRDRTVPWEVQEHVIGLLSGLRTREIDAGHNVMLTHPKTLATLLNEIAAGQ